MSAEVDPGPIPFDPDPPARHGALACGPAVLLLRRTCARIEQLSALTPDEAADLAAELMAAATAARLLGRRPLADGETP